MSSPASPPSCRATSSAATRPDIIVVGNGGELVGRGLGRVIDSFETVVRCNDFRKSIKHHPGDFGTKTDIIVWPRHDEIVSRLCRAYEARAWITKDWEPSYPHPKDLPKYSRGLLANLMVVEIVRPRRYWCVSMEALCEGVRKGRAQQVYYAKRRETKGAMHHWDRERAILDAALAERKVEMRRVNDF